MAAMVPDQQTMASFVNVTQLLMSQENVIRKQAEETYKGYVDKNPSLVMTLLVNILQAGDAVGTVQLRTFAPVLLRQLVASARRQHLVGCPQHAASCAGQSHSWHLRQLL